MKTFLKSKSHYAVVMSITVLALLEWSSISAKETDPALTMTVIIDRAHGGKVAAGKYERAIEKIMASKRNVDPFARHTNLCVAYTKTRNIDSATRSCESALDLIREEGERRRSLYSGDRHRQFLALALSNLGVLDIVKGTPDVARARFQEAIDLDSGTAAARTNLDRLSAGLRD